MGYSRKNIETHTEECLFGVDGLYNAKMVNYKGKTAKKDGGEFYTEIVAKTILENIEALEGIEPVKRTEDYWSSSRDCSSYKPDGVRGEEMTAMELRMQGKISGLGEIMDYQVPLKNTINDKAGKIDVLSFDSNGVMRILELKRKGNREDTLLRCVLEAYTYFKRVEQEKLRSEYAAKAGAPCSCLKACPIFFEDSRQYDEYTELDARPNLKALMKALEIELILLEGTYPNYSAKILPY